VQEVVEDVGGDDDTFARKRVEVGEEPTRSSYKNWFTTHSSHHVWQGEDAAAQSPDYEYQSDDNIKETDGWQNEDPEEESHHDWDNEDEIPNSHHDWQGVHPIDTIHEWQEEDDVQSWSYEQKLFLVLLVWLGLLIFTLAVFTTVTIILRRKRKDRIIVSQLGSSTWHLVNAPSQEKTYS